jgi:hypothetical protein
LETKSKFNTTKIRHNSEIAWITASKGSLEKQIGAECLEPEKQVWGAQFPQQADQYEQK